MNNWALLDKPEAVAALCSAFAAAASAIAALLSWRAQIQTLRHTFRPELVLSQWQRLSSQRPNCETLQFGTIKNVGRATAKQIIINATSFADDNRPQYVLSSQAIGGLAAGEIAQVDGQIIIVWNNVARASDGRKMLMVAIRVWCWDALNVRHTTTVSVMVAQELDDHIGGVPQVAPGTFLWSHVTESTPVWLLRVRGQLAKIPMFGRRFRDDA